MLTVLLTRGGETVRHEGWHCGKDSTTLCGITPATLVTSGTMTSLQGPRCLLEGRWSGLHRQRRCPNWRLPPTVDS